MNKVIGWALALTACMATWMGATVARADPIALEAEVLAELNLARADPLRFAQELRDYRARFDGAIVRYPDDPVGEATVEGVEAVDEAIAFLERQKPLPPLSAAQILALAARDHAAEQGPRGTIGHRSGDGLSPGDRVKRRGGDVYVGENISYGISYARGVVRQFIVDDGVPGRGHRKLIFSDGYRFAGVGCGMHMLYRFMCVVNLSATADGNPVLPGGSAARR